jgi:hypothetical protein
MGCLRLDATMVLYRRRDVSLSIGAEQSQYPNGLYCPLQPQDKPHRAQTPLTASHTPNLHITTHPSAQQTRMRHCRTILASRLLWV